MARGKDYTTMISGGAFSEVMEAVGKGHWPEHWTSDEMYLHAAIRKMPDGTKKYWVHLGHMDDKDFRLDNPNITWFDDPQVADAWVLACWRMR